NAVNFGVAQKRERIVIIGIRNDLTKKIKFSFPKECEKKFVLRDVLKNVPASEFTKYSKPKEKVLKLVPAGGYWRDLPEKIAKEYMGKSFYSGGGRTGMARRLSWDEPSLTVLCSPSQKQTERCHPDETRPFTVRENARIQSFPDDWEFCGSVSAKYKQIGNAVPVEFARRVGEEIFKSLSQFEEKK
ncbi:MAG: DNA cytosine methyltransferase, partial [Fusobacteriaceae bacterium]